MLFSEFINRNDDARILNLFAFKFANNMNKTKLEESQLFTTKQKTKKPNFMIFLSVNIYHRNSSSFDAHLFCETSFHILML